MAYVNADDPLAMESYIFLKALVDRGLEGDVDLGQGGHGFLDYVLSGFVVKAFGFVLEKTRP